MTGSARRCIVLRHAPGAASRNRRRAAGARIPSAPRGPAAFDETGQHAWTPGGAGACPYPTIVAADAIEHIAVDRIVTPAVLGRARDGTLDYQTAKWVWHCMARFGLERENAG